MSKKVAGIFHKTISPKQFLYFTTDVLITINTCAQFIMKDIMLIIKPLVSSWLSTKI